MTTEKIIDSTRLKITSTWLFVCLTLSRSKSFLSECSLFLFSTTSNFPCIPIRFVLLCREQSNEDLFNRTDGFTHYLCSRACEILKILMIEGLKGSFGRRTDLIEFVFLYSRRRAWNEVKFLIYRGWVDRRREENIDVWPACTCVCLEDWWTQQSKYRE